MTGSAVFRQQARNSQGNRPRNLALITWHAPCKPYALFVRDGLGREVLRKLRRGHWIVQDCVDLHGLNREEARPRLAEFLGACVKRGLRCVRVIHGKGLRSPRGEPVLKGKVQRWLAQRDEVLAYCQAPANEGGSGALLVLLSARAAGPGGF